MLRPGDRAQARLCRSLQQSRRHVQQTERAATRRSSISRKRSRSSRIWRLLSTTGALRCNCSSVSTRRWRATTAPLRSGRITRRPSAIAGRAFGEMKRLDEALADIEKAIGARSRAKLSQGRSVSIRKCISVNWREFEQDCCASDFRVQTRELRRAAVHVAACVGGSGDPAAVRGAFRCRPVSGGCGAAVARRAVWA